jgi:hypothetical protein
LIAAKELAMRFLPVSLVFGLLLLQPAAALTFQDFVQCVGISGQGSVCQLDPGLYPVSQTIVIARSNLSIEGAASSPRTTLQRSPGFLGPLFQDNWPSTPPLSSVVFENLTIDGNRANNLSVWSSYSPEISSFGIKDIQFLNCSFVNSPNLSQGLYGGGTSGVLVDHRYFGNPAVYGLWSDALGDNGDITYQECPTKQFVDHVIVENSQFVDAGEPAILGEMRSVWILHSLFTNNHSNSLPFGDSGGQIVLTICTNNAVIWKNTFQNGSAGSNGQTADGIELRGTNTSVIDNLVTDNSGGGITMDGVQDVFIADSSAGQGSFENAHSGIEIAHSNSSLRRTDWVVIDSANSTGNQEWGVWSDTSNTTPKQPVNHLAITNTCLSGNLLGPSYDNLGRDVVLLDNLFSNCK